MLAIIDMSAEDRGAAAKYERQAQLLKAYLASQSSMERAALAQERAKVAALEASVTALGDHSSELLQRLSGKTVELEKTRATAASAESYKAAVEVLQASATASDQRAARLETEVLAAAAKGASEAAALYKPALVASNEALAAAEAKAVKAEMENAILKRMKEAAAHGKAAVDAQFDAYADECQRKIDSIKQDSAKAKAQLKDALAAKEKERQVRAACVCGAAPERSPS